MPVSGHVRLPRGHSVVLGDPREGLQTQTATEEETGREL